LVSCSVHHSKSTLCLLASDSCAFTEPNRSLNDARICIAIDYAPSTAATVPTWAFWPRPATATDDMAAVFSRLRWPKRCSVGGSGCLTHGLGPSHMVLPD
jgi:hypothetical protein